MGVGSLGGVGLGVKATVARARRAARSWGGRAAGLMGFMGCPLGLVLGATRKAATRVGGCGLCSVASVFNCSESGGLLTPTIFGFYSSWNE